MKEIEKIEESQPKKERKKIVKTEKETKDS